MDIQVCIDMTSLGAYLLKYITKAEPRSGVLEHLLSLNVETSRNPNYTCALSYLQHSLFD